jgi:VWFA-related protein
MTSAVASAMKRGVLLVAALALLATAPGVRAASSPAALTGAGADPLLWPESQRAFLQDGPALLLDAADRARFLGLDEAGRDAFIRDFLGRDPIPETPENELARGIALRRRLAAADYPTPQDVRAQLTFLRGRPADKLVLDCPVAFKPMEIWTYHDGDKATELLLYRPSAGDPFRLWLPIDSKRVLYTSDMEFWLDQWEVDHPRGKRVDLFFCPAAARVDQISGIEGLRGEVIASATTVRSRPGQETTREERDYRWVRPKDRAALLAAPADLAVWARAAATTELPPPPPALPAADLAFDFPRWSGSRLVARALLTLPADAAVKPVDVEGHPRLRLTVEGLLDQEGLAFEQFRVRFRLAPPADRAPLALLFERPLRPGQSFVVRLKVQDEGSGAVGTIERALRVPAAPVVRFAGQVAAAGLGESADVAAASGPDRLLLLPPPADVLLSVWRADAMVTGARIKKVVFSVDGEEQMTRSRPPFSAEVRLPHLPRETVVRAEGFDEAGTSVAADQVVLNKAEGGFRVFITDPPLGRRVHGKIRARAEVTTPEERKVEAVEFRLNDRPVATLERPPWIQEIDVPEQGDLAYLTVVARLDDGTKTESVRFLRAPANFSQVDVDLVELYVAVSDGGGHPIQGLAASDFEVYEAGKSKTINRFEAVENLPLSIGIALDTSFSMAPSIGEAAQAARALLHNLVTPRDRCFTLTFGGSPSILMPPVDDVAAAVDSLEGVQAFGRTALYDGVITSLYLSRAQRGQRALVLLTDGEDTVSSATWEQALEYARRAGVAIYTVGLDVPEHKLGVRAKLNELAAVSGGRSFYIAHADELAGVYKLIGEELRSRYLLIFDGDPTPGNEGLREVEVKSRKGKTRVSRGVAG